MTDEKPDIKIGVPTPNLTITATEVRMKEQEEIVRASSKLRPLLDFVRLAPTASLPFRAYGASAAFDISANLVGSDGRFRTATVGPGITQAIPTGLAVRPPRGTCVLICSRSGFASEGVFVANAPGVVDPDYTGEIKVLLVNCGLKPFYVKHGDRIAQLMVVPFASCDLHEVGSFPETERGDKGFGSTGR